MKTQIIRLIILIALLTAGGFSCTKDKNPEVDNMVSIRFQCYVTDAVDPNIVSFALPGIVDATCLESLPYPVDEGNPNVLSPHWWSIHLVLTKGTDRTKLTPIISLAPGAKITPESGIMHDFTDGLEWTLIAPDGSTVRYVVYPVFVIGDPCTIIDGVDEDGNPNYITIYPDDPRYPY